MKSAVRSARAVVRAERQEAKRQIQKDMAQRVADSESDALELSHYFDDDGFENSESVRAQYEKEYWDFVEAVEEEFFDSDFDDDVGEMPPDFEPFIDEWAEELA